MRIFSTPLPRLRFVAAISLPLLSDANATIEISDATPCSIADHCRCVTIFAAIAHFATIFAAFRHAACMPATPFSAFRLWLTFF